MAQYQGDDQQRTRWRPWALVLAPVRWAPSAARWPTSWAWKRQKLLSSTQARAGWRRAPADLWPGGLPAGMVSESVLQEPPQSTPEQMWQNHAEGKDISDGVEGAIAGGVMGAGDNIRGRRTEG